jgi:hypothetical protein
VTDEWIKQVQAMQPDDQVKAVAQKLKDLNPGFDGVLKPTFDTAGAVTKLRLVTDRVTDMSPVRALPRLVDLTAHGSGPNKGTLQSVAPLKGLPLTDLDLLNNKVRDLAPLRGMKLQSLNVAEQPVADLSPLQDMPLTVLYCGGTNIGNLRPLQGMPLKILQLNRCRLISDLKPLQKLPLEKLRIDDTSVSDLSPLTEITLAHFWCNNNPSLVDLSPLRVHNLKHLTCDRTGIQQLTPLARAPLQEINCDFNYWRDAELLRSIQTLETINKTPQRDFWKKVDAEQAKFEGWCQEVARLPIANQPHAVFLEMQRRNKFTGTKFVPKTDPRDRAVREFSLISTHIFDLEPLRALPKLEKLTCRATETVRGKLTNLWPLKGLPLIELDCRHHPVSNLTPLQGMGLVSLKISRTNVADLTPLRECVKLKRLECEDCLVVDLSPIQELHLREIKCTFVAERDAKILRSIKSLEKINGMAKDNFWKSVDKTGANRCKGNVWRIPSRFIGSRLRDVRRARNDKSRFDLSQRLPGGIRERPLPGFRNLLQGGACLLRVLAQLSQEVGRQNHDVFIAIGEQFHHRGHV